MLDILISDLEHRNKITKELVAYCQSQGLNSLSSIVDFFLSEKNTEKIEKITPNLRIQLKELCKRCFNQDFRYNATLDMSILQLSIVESMSQRSLNVCDAGNLKTLDALLKYRSAYSGFLFLRNCGKNSNKELLQICDKYDKLILSGFINKKDSTLDAEVESITKNFDVEFASEGLIENIDLDRLADIEKMSVRSYNVCKHANLTSLKLLIQYYYNYGGKGFLSIQNCGQTSNRELITICHAYDNSVKSVKKVNVEFTSVELIENIELQSLAGIEDMSVRSINVCKFANLTSLRLIIQYYFDTNKKGFLSLRHCGRIANLELITICQKYENSVKSIKKVNVSIKDHFSPIETFLNNLNLSISDFRNVKQSIAGLDYIPIFKVLNILIDSNYLFHNEKHTFIFKETFNIYLPQHNYTLEDVGGKIILTRERVRQIREKINRRIRYAFKFIHNNNCKTVYPEYINTINRPLIFVTDDKANQINQNENTNFSPLFITLILSVIFSDHFVRIGDLTTLFSKSVLKENNIIKHLFLVNRLIAAKFHFDQLLKYFTLIGCQRRKEDEIILFKALIKKFKIGTVSEEQEIINVINEIVISEFNSIAEVKPEGVIFFRNKKRTLTSYIVEILQHSYKPLHFTEIHQRLIDQGVNPTSEQATHAILNRENEIFGLKGSGTFDLRSKGGLFGTIGDVAEQLLLKRTEPIPMAELENLICHELIVSKDSIRELLFHYNHEDRFGKDRYGNVKLKKWQKAQIQ